MAENSAPQVVLRVARDFFTDPRTVGVAKAAPRTAAFVARSWAANRRAVSEGREEGRPRPSFGLAAQVLLDEVLISAMRNPKLFPEAEDYRRAGLDMLAAHELWQREGWLDAPEQYHLEAPHPDEWSLRLERSVNQRFQHLTFRSLYEPHAGEPGRERWLSREPNRTAHAYVLRHRRPGRPWLVCVHGFGTGQASVDLRAFRATHLYRRLGLNLLLPVLPLHGPRQDPGAVRGAGFMTIDLIDCVHGVAQAASDIRSAIRWVRATAGDAPVGIYGISLGGYVASVVASLEEGLACAIAGIPATDMLELYRRHSPPVVRRKAYEAGALGPTADAVASVISPLVLRPKVSPQRRYLFAGLGDRMSTARQATRLWEHWERPRIVWYPGGHVGFWFARGVGEFVDEALAEAGLAEPSEAQPFPTREAFRP